jgi:hypothetical protein
LLDALYIWCSGNIWQQTGRNVYGNVRSRSAHVQGKWKCGLYEACGFRLCYLLASILQTVFEFVIFYGYGSFYSEFHLLMLV